MLRNLFLNTLLILGSFLVCLVIAEIVSRLFFPDTRIRYVPDDELLAVLEPNQEGFIYLSDGSRAPEVRINELGLRGASPEKSAPRRVLVLGDSFTFGSGVEEAEMFTTVLNASLGEEVSVVNAGHPGYGIYQIEILFQRLYPQLQPDVVVLVIWESLILRQRYTKQGHEDFVAQLKKMNLLKSLSVFGTHIYRLYEQVALSYGADDMVVALQATKESELSDEFLYERAVRLDSERILRINETVQSKGGKFVLVVWPRKGYVENDVDTHMSDWLTDQYEAFGIRNNIPTFTVQDVLQPFPPEDLTIPNDGHPTALAHCLVARRLGEIMTELGYPAKQPVRCVAE